MISEPMVCLAQSVHLTYTDTNNVSKRIEMRFHMTHVTWVFYQVCPKWFWSLWYAGSKPCTYLAPILTLSLNGPKWDSTWPTSPRCSIGSVQNDFWACGMFCVKPCTYLASRFALSPNGPKRASTWASSRRSSIGCVHNDFWAYGTFGANRAPIMYRY
jgi:hypothetical protein